MKAFLRFLGQHIDLSPEEESFVASTLHVKSLSKREIIQTEGDIAQSFFFVLEGLVRLFYVNDKGEERTAFFYDAGQFVSDYESYLYARPSRLNLQAMEATELVVITRESAEKLLAYSPKFSAMAMAAMESELVIYQRMIARLLTMNPEERYANLLEESPDIFQRVPQLYIASYLGVQPESLSRIKQRLAKS